MKIINTKLHGVLDYSIALALLLPWIVDYGHADEDTMMLASFGGLILFYSLLTDYEFGLIKLFPIKVHLLFDILVGIVLSFSPWLFDIGNYFLYWPSLIGIGELILVVLTETQPYRVTKKDLDITKP